MTTLQKQNKELKKWKLPTLQIDTQLSELFPEVYSLLRS